jgi:hypothetical protein
VDENSYGNQSQLTEDGGPTSIASTVQAVDEENVRTLPCMRFNFEFMNRADK